MNILEKIKGQGYFLIAEIGVNYYDIAEQRGLSVMEAAKLMVDEAVRSGLDAVKFQTYKAEKLASRYSPSYWDTNEESTTSQYELFKKFDMFGYEEYKELAAYCEEKGIIFMSTPFDFESADYLNDLMPAYKISSSDITNVPFIRHMAKKKKPILISTGASNMEEIKKAINVIEEEGVSDIVILHCVLEYPTPFEHANLDMILSLKKEFPDKILGYSDHTRPDSNMDVLKTSWILGGTVLEKHFTIDKTLKGNDHYHAMDPNDARKLKDGLDFLIKIKGKESKDCLETEKISRLNARRSIVANMNIIKGTYITEEMITFKRPGTGISPSEIDKVVGKVAKIDIDEDTILHYEMID
jgi:N-acetylneuraminate synthase